MAYSPISQKKYNEKCKFYTIKLHGENDKAMIEHIESHKGDSVQAFLKKLVQKDMESEG